MFGMLIGLVRQRWGLFLPGVAWMGILRLPFGTLALALTLVLAFSIVAMHWGASLPLSMGLVAVVVVGWAALNASPSGESPVRVGAAVLGDASYSIYLTHSFLLGPLARLYGALGLSWAWIWAYMALSMFGAVLLGVWVFRRIERPLLRRMQNVGAGINDSPASRMRA
jgi:peptidoglycan/LPS O-acetylase OafA/YrhL